MRFRARGALVALLGLAALCACGSPQHSAIAPPSAVDIGFAQDMSTHHDQALLMSQLALKDGTSAVKDIAAAILSGQAQEIGALRGWLQVWGQPPANPIPMGWMTMSPSAKPSASMSPMSGMSDMPGMSAPNATATPGSMDYAPMPGMATPAQMIRLTNARGKAFDVLFAQLMTRHHLGGIAMDRAAIAQGASPLVAQLAGQEITEQFQDIAYLTAVLRSYGVKVN
ncbi:DUF305 domain-containing protein [Nocardioides baekrokdamisoli]|uniref:DUF305 domain-containing protein n=1 Tax=Nocardioides baekrokdamisoli TaxID=1804624 RepID=A0A3G9IX92_9ACTN|nr:DUF305 domain-containing protein [Nocardioides baekrokdamisoli]BBH18311.1 DUF305 domain-containing protein [Nocardioides baekrokdamisoli]